jgi:hypothetical protein
MYEDITEEIELERIERLSRMSFSSYDTIDLVSLKSHDFNRSIFELIEEIERYLNFLEDIKVEEIIDSYNRIEEKLEKKSFFERFCFC